MGLFEIISQKYEERLIAKAKQIEIEKIKRLQAKEVQYRKERERELRLASAEIPKDFIIRMGRDIVDQNGRFKYTLYEYFVCSVKPKDMRYGQCANVVKVSGTSFGKAYDMYVHSGPFSSSLTKTEMYIGGALWEGDIEDKVYIPQECKTIADLRDYAKKDNEKTIDKYNEDLKIRKKEEQDIISQFFR